MALFQVSETKTFKIDCSCSMQEITLSWINYLGGFEYFNFTAKKDLLVEIRETGQSVKNVFQNWPKSYGAFSDTIRKENYRDSNKSYVVRSQNLTRDQVDGLAYIKSSVLVQIVNSITDRRTVILDSDSFIVRSEGQDIYTISFTISFTDDIPSQTA